MEKNEYPNIPSVIRPVSHSDEIPIPICPDSWNWKMRQSSVNAEQIPLSSNSEFEGKDLNARHLVTQGELNDLVQDLNLSKAQAELVGYRVKEWSLLQ